MMQDWSDYLDQLRGGDDSSRFADHWNVVTVDFGDRAARGR